jgi:D-glycero-D-manno-heptose 1,7-bisphosphate phosphatase
MKYIFIDRDGVVNKDPGGWTRYSYVTKWGEFHFLPGSLEALKKLRRAGIGVIVVSNQAGVSKEYFSESQLKDVTNKMMDEINKSGGKIDGVYYCTHRDEDNCLCRKPKTGLLDKAAARHAVDLHKTYFVGDSLVDIIAGRKAGLKTVFVLSGKTPRAEMEKWAQKPDCIFDDLLSAADWIIKKEKRKSTRAARRNA